MELFKFSIPSGLIFLIVISVCDAIQSQQPEPKKSDKTRRDDSDTETTESDEGTAPTSAAPATVSFASFRMPPFSFAPAHPQYPPPPHHLFAQIPAPPPPPPMMMTSHHHPYHMMTAASSPFTAYYRPLPPPPPPPHHMMTARMSLHPMYPPPSPFMPPPPPRTMLPVMVPIKRWDEHSSLFDSMLSSDTGMENSFLDEPLVFDEEELLAARRHIPSPPPPPPAHRRDSFDPFPVRQSHPRHHHHSYPSRDRDTYDEPIPSENRYDGPGERIPYNKHEREYEDRPQLERHVRDHERHAPSRSLNPVPETPAPASLDLYEEHIPREGGHPIDRQDHHPHPPPPSVDEYRREP